MPITEVGYPYCCQCCVTIYVIKTALRLCCRRFPQLLPVVSPPPTFSSSPQPTTPNTTAFTYSFKLFPFDAALAVFRKLQLQQLGIGSNMARNAPQQRAFSFLYLASAQSVTATTYSPPLCPLPLSLTSSSSSSSSSSSTLARSPSLPKAVCPPPHP